MRSGGFPEDQTRRRDKSRRRPGTVGRPRELVDTADRQWRLKRYPQAALLALSIGWIIAVMAGSDTPAETGILGGDYPAFYGAGSIVNDGLVDRLYDFELQASMQTDLLPTGFLAFAYPPFVAAPYALLALLPYRLSYALSTVLSFAAVVLALRLMRTISTQPKDHWWMTLAAGVLFYPILRALLGGQNTAASLLILVSSWTLLMGERDVAAGGVLALLSFKPQFLLPILGVVWLTGRRRVVLGASVGVAGLYLGGVAMAGWSWPIEWWNEATKFAFLDEAVNSANSISLRQIADWPIIGPAWLVLSVATAGWIAWVAHRHGERDLTGVMAMAIPATLLMAPHAMYYDVGLVLPSILVLADRYSVRLGAIFWMAGLSHVLSSQLGFNPLTLLLVALLVTTRRSIP